MFQRLTQPVVPFKADREVGAPLHVPVDPPDGGLTALSVVLCDHIRSISKERVRRFSGILSEETMAIVDDRLRILLQL